MMLDLRKKISKRVTVSSWRPAGTMVVGRAREETEAAEAPSRSPERMRDWSRLRRLRWGPTSVEVVSGRWGRRWGGRVAAEGVQRRLDAETTSTAEKAKLNRPPLLRREPSSIPSRRSKIFKF